MNYELLRRLSRSRAFPTYSSLMLQEMQGPRRQMPIHPILQMQRKFGNQAVARMLYGGVNQKNEDKKDEGGWFSNMFSNFSLQDTINQSVREGVSAGFGSESVDLYDMWKLRKDPEKLDQFMRDRIHRMDGGLQ